MLKINIAKSLLCIFLLGASFAYSQTWPSKSITLIVPAGAGGFTDIVARNVAAKLSLKLGQSVIVDNRPGANGVLGVATAAKARPDGYSFILGTSTTMAANVYLYKNFPVDPLRDFVPLALIGDIPFAYAVPVDSPFKSMGDFIRAARSAPGKITYGSGTSSAVLCAEILKAEAKIELMRIPYKTGPQALIDLMAGRIDMVCESIATLMVDATGNKKLRALALAQPQRTSFAPDVETVAEAGFGNVYYAAWLGFWAPSGTPKDIVQRLSGELLAVLRDPEFRASMLFWGLSAPPAIEPGILAEAHREEIKKLEKLVKLGIIEAQ